MNARKHILRAAICILLLLSPLGGPVVGLVIGGLCPNDPTVTPDGPFALGLSYCGVSRPIEHLYQQAEMLTILPMAYAGSIVGGIITLAWWCLAAAVAGGFIWHLCRALACAMKSRA